MGVNAGRHDRSRAAALAAPRIGPCGAGAGRRAGRRRGLVCAVLRHAANGCHFCAADEVVSRCHATRSSDTIACRTCARNHGQRCAGCSPGLAGASACCSTVVCRDAVGGFGLGFSAAARAAKTSADAVTAGAELRSRSRGRSDYSRRPIAVAATALVGRACRQRVPLPRPRPRSRQTRVDSSPRPYRCALAQSPRSPAPA